MTDKYGKSLINLLSHKKSFFDSNDDLLSDLKSINDVYIKQPRRKHCKNCNSKLLGSSFVKQNVKYIICHKCEHLNGSHEDTDEFCSALYTEDDGQKYASNYNVKNISEYNKRVTDIYLPKAKYLKKSLLTIEKKPELLSYVDFGAGSGYFISAMRKAGFSNSIGYEVSKSQTEMGNSILGRKSIILHSKNDTLNIINSLTADVVSMIGVLEHLQNPRDVLSALKKNTNVRFLFISVPTFSPSVFLEAVFPEAMHRQLSGGHTHLYTEKSLEHLISEFDLKKVSAWWFGADMMDFYRFIYTSLKANKDTQEIVEEWSKVFIPLMDQMQIEIDKKHLSSEVHMLLEFPRD
jgi:2-polyprenyl-3-methyl-5-hydroxy-6-metoxy-1,4-benzoquinol methylase